MKRNIIHTLWMAAALPLCAVLASCEQEDFPGMADVSGTQPLSITVTDGGYAADGKSGSTSRAVENNLATVFTAGDKCGLYIVHDGKLVSDNVCLTAKEGGDGSLVWAPDEGVTLSGGSDGDRYFLYYPYKDGNHEVDTSKTDDTEFFKSLISGWEVKNDQSSYADYTASDLMTATTTTLSNNERSLTFNMTHRMALSVIEVPRTVYHFTNGNGTIPDYVIKTTDFSDSELKPCCMSDGSYRYIARPGTTSKISGSYSNKSKNFAVTPNTTTGAFKTYIVDGGKVDTKQHNLQIGDYLLADGSLISKESELNEEQKQNVRAVVFWSPAETDYTDTNRESPARLTDDKIMNKEHPDCVHGLAVALDDVASCCWMQGGNNTYYSVWWSFQKEDSFYSPSYSDYASVQLGFENKKIPGNKVLGYNNTQVIRAYNALYDADDHMRVTAVDKLDEWEKNNPAPDNTTGWYMPSIKELSMLCCGDIDVVLDVRLGSAVRTAVNNFLVNIGNEIKSEEYWSSTEAYTPLSSGMNYTSYALTVYFYNGYVYMSNKGDCKSYKVRAVCAF